ncbi:MAG: endonuclease domain-containing protein [Patescibacteria group bacterium]
MLRYAVTCTHPPKTRFAKKLRKDQTPGEIKLWKALRSGRFHGLKFRRQVPVGPYIVDFLCPAKKLIIEVDGDSHFEPGAKEKDATREEFLRKQRFAVLRILNSEAVCDLEAALAKLAYAVGYTED